MAIQLSPPKQNRPCLLLDVSYSMNTNDGRGRRIDLLRKAVDTVPNLGRFPFTVFLTNASKCAASETFLSLSRGQQWTMHSL